MLPPRPDDAVPVPISSDPLFPELDVPVLNIRSPLTPDEPEFALDISTEPLEDWEP